MPRTTPANGTTEKVAPFATPVETLVSSLIAATLVDGATVETVTTATHSALRSVRPKDRAPYVMAIAARFTEVPVTLVGSLVTAVESAPYGKDPIIAATDALVAAMRSSRAILVAASSAGLTVPALTEPTAEELATATAKVARWLDGKGSGGTGESRTVHPARVLPKGTFSHRYDDGSIGTVTADGKTPDRVTLGSESLALTTAAQRDAKAHGGTGAAVNGWQHWHFSADGTGPTASECGKVVA